MKDILDRWQQYVNEKEVLEEGWKEKVAAGLIGLGALSPAVAHAHDTQAAQEITTGQMHPGIGDTETLFSGSGSAEAPYILTIQLPEHIKAMKDVAAAKKIAESWLKQEMLKLINDRIKQLDLPAETAMDFNFSSLTYTDVDGYPVTNPAAAQMAQAEGQVIK